MNCVEKDRRMRSLKQALSLIAAACCAAPLAAWPQAYPAKPIRTLVTISGVGEALCRLVGQKMAENIGVPVIVEAQAAAGGSVAVETVMKAAPDGYTILSANPGTHVMRQFLSKSTTFDPIRDFTPISLAWETIAVVGVHPSLPVKDFKELLDYARRNPGKLSYGTSGIGTSHHMASELVKLRTGVDMVHVPYKSGAQSFTDLISGQIPVLYGVLAQLQPAAKAGKMRLIAIQNDRRYPPAGDILPIRETVPGYSSPPYWTAYYGPAHLPDPLVRRLNVEINKAISAPEIKAKLDEAGFLVIGTTPEELLATNKADIERMAAVVKAAGITPE
jgi:tripartite-type tricarboxylate transporter receptor subunit TctC